MKYLKSPKQYYRGNSKLEESDLNDIKDIFQDILDEYTLIRSYTLLGAKKNGYVYKYWNSNHTTCDEKDEVYAFTIYIMRPLNNVMIYHSLLDFIKRLELAGYKIYNNLENPYINEFFIEIYNVR